MMRQHCLALGCGLLIGLWVAAGLASQAAADVARGYPAVPGEAVGPVLSDPGVVYPGPGVELPVDSMWKPRRIRYQSHKLLLKKKACRDCTPPVQTVLVVKDPCTGCPVEVPICLPVCCLTDPCPNVRSRCGLLKRGVVTYKWCCGIKARIVFERCGGITVHTYGV